MVHVPPEVTVKLLDIANEIARRGQATTAVEVVEAYKELYAGVVEAERSQEPPKGGLPGPQGRGSRSSRVQVRGE